MTVHDKVIKIIAEQGLLDVGDVSQTATLQDLGIDCMFVRNRIRAHWACTRVPNWQTSIPSQGLAQSQLL